MTVDMPYPSAVADTPAPSYSSVLSNDALRSAIEIWGNNGGPASTAAQTYGPVMGNWDVSQLQDFSKAFGCINLNDCT